METLRVYVIGGQSHNSILLTLVSVKGQHPDRSDWPRPPRRLRFAHNHLGSYKPFVLKLAHTGWDGPMDESGAYRSGKLWVREDSPN